MRNNYLICVILVALSSASIAEQKKAELLHEITDVDHWETGFKESTRWWVCSFDGSAEQVVAPFAADGMLMCK